MSEIAARSPSDPTVAKPPRWDLASIYPGLDSPEFHRDVERLETLLSDLEVFTAAQGIGGAAPSSASKDPDPAAAALDGALERLNATLILLETLNAYVYGFVSTDSYDRAAARRLSELEQLEVRLRKQRTRFTAWIGALGSGLGDVAGRSRLGPEHRLVLDDLAEQSRHLMETRLEDLASELLLGGGGVMWKLQGNVTSQLKAPFTRDGKTEMLPMTVIRNLAFDPSEEIRRRAYETELAAWESIREPIAFALNGVKGSAATLARWRGREDVLEASLELNRIDRATLEALLGAIRDNFPVFRRYLKSKARKLGQERLPWWNLLAPVGEAAPAWSWEAASRFIVEQFGRFSEDLARFARSAFDRGWIDAEPRDGKRGGAFCMTVPGLDQSRILTNFDGSFDQLVTVAHELGHGYHAQCQSGLPMLRRGAPMTLAETASTFCETVVFNAALETAPPAARLLILENALAGATQVTVDISSRFLFESEVFRRRQAAELGADELCEIMLRAQKETYGDALDPEHLHPYMWVMKPHYYQTDLNFYNFPYAFGQLFGLGMYAIYRRDGDSFLPRYRELLRATGAGPAADLVARFGIDIRSRKFWNGSIRLLEEQVGMYEAL